MDTGFQVKVQPHRKPQPDYVCVLQPAAAVMVVVGVVGVDGRMELTSKPRCQTGSLTHNKL